MYLEEFQSRTVGIQITQMHRVAMSEADSIEQLAIVIHSCRTPDDFVLAISVNVSHREVVVTIGIHRILAQS